MGNESPLETMFKTWLGTALSTHRSYGIFKTMSRSSPILCRGIFFLVICLSLFFLHPSRCIMQLALRGRKVHFLFQNNRTTINPMNETIDSSQHQDVSYIPWERTMALFTSLSSFGMTSSSPNAGLWDSGTILNVIHKYLQASKWTNRYLILNNKLTHGHHEQNTIFWDEELIN